MTDTEREALIAEYEELRSRLNGYDQETIKLRREIDAQVKRWVADRKEERTELVARKGELFKILNAPPAPEPLTPDQARWGVKHVEVVGDPIAATEAPPSAPVEIARLEDDGAPAAAVLSVGTPVTDGEASGVVVAPPADAPVAVVAPNGDLASQSAGGGDGDDADTVDEDPAVDGKADEKEEAEPTATRQSKRGSRKR